MHLRQPMTKLRRGQPPPEAFDSLETLLQGLASHLAGKVLLRVLQYNGGLPWLVFLEADDGREYVLPKLYSIGSGDPSNLDNLCKCHDWPASYKNGTIVIGRDTGGSQFLMATKGDDTGTIYFLNREVTLRPKGRVNRVAGSFKEMMDKLQPLFPEGLNFQS